jgi:hypothetical protein
MDINDIQQEYDDYRNNNLHKMKKYGYPLFRGKPHQYDNEVYQKLIKKGFAEFSKPFCYIWNVYFCLMRRARYLQVQYYPTWKEILFIHKNNIERAKGYIRLKTKLAIKNNKLKKLTQCENWRQNEDINRL